MLKTFQKISDIVNKISFILCGALMAYLAVVVVAGVICRFAGNALFWSEESARYCYVWLLFLATPITIKYSNGAKMDFIQPLLKGRGLTIYKIIMYILVAICSVVMLVSGAPMIGRTWMQRSPALGIPMGLIYLSFPLCGGIILIHCMNGILQRIFGKGDEEIREEERKA